MVEEHTAPAQRLAEGLRSLPSGQTALTATMGAYWFLNNDAVALPHLAQPLWAAAREGVQQHCQQMALVVHDWSKLNFYQHSRKQHRLPADRHGRPDGYEIFTSLYWRWNIESFFKLLKSAGMDVEAWRQTTPAAIARRLLVASMACVLVWQLAASTTPPAKEMQHLLVRLSGRQMRYNKPFTKPALLTGLWVFLAMLHTLEQYTPNELRRLADFTLPLLRAGPTR
jgi:hypothetical protein